MIIRRRVRTSLGLILVGLLVQLVTSLFWSPLMFIVFAGVGLPLVLAGVFFFARTVWRGARPLDSLGDEERDL